MIFEINDIFYYYFYSTAITHLLYAMELQTVYHLIAKDKIAEQHILGKYSNCNSFGATKALPNSKNIIIAITQLYNVQQVWNFTMW